MVQRERWEEIRRLRFEDGVSVSEIARRLDLDRKTIRRCLRQEEWRPYVRTLKAQRLLADHAQFLRERAAQVSYSARILYQELRRERGYTGSYETVKRFVAPLRESGRAEALCQMRFETAPGEQSQIDWGQLRTYFRAPPMTLDLFVLTLGFSRPSLRQTSSQHKRRCVVKSVLDSPFEYTPSSQTDVRKTFGRIRREQQAKIRQEQRTQVSPLVGAALLPNSPAERCEKRFSTQISERKR